MPSSPFVNNNGHMLGYDAASVFLLVASVSVVLLTALAVIVSIFAIRAVMEVLSLVRLLRSEAEKFVSGRRTLFRQVQLIGKWIALFAKRIIGAP